MRGWPEGEIHAKRSLGLRVRDGELVLGDDDGKLVCGPTRKRGEETAGVMGEWGREAKGFYEEECVLVSRFCVEIT